MTLYTLENKKEIKYLVFRKSVVPYLITTVACLIFSIIYAQFSRGVSSYYMTFLFAFPLIFGVVVGMCVMLIKKTKREYFFATHFYHTGVVALTLSSLLRGIFDIAGTASQYQTILMIFGIASIVISICALIIEKIFFKSS